MTTNPTDAAPAPEPLPDGLDALSGGITIDGARDAFAGQFPELDEDGYPTSLGSDEEPPPREEAEGEDSGEAPDGEEGQEAPADADASEPEEITLADLAKALDVEESALAEGLRVKVGKDGEEKTVSLSEALASIPSEKDIRRQVDTQVRQATRAAQQEAQKKQENLLQQAQVFWKTGQELLGIDQNSQYLAELRKQDPAEYLSTLDDIKQRAEYFQQAAKSMFEQVQQQQQQALQDAWRRAGEELREKHDDWGDEHIQAAVETVRELGLTDDEVYRMADSRLLAGAYEIHRLRKENAELKAKVVPATASAPKTKGQLAQRLAAAKPSGKRTSVLKERLSRVQKTGSMEDAQSAFAALFRGQ